MATKKNQTNKQQIWKKVTQSFGLEQLIHIHDITLQNCVYAQAALEAVYTFTYCTLEALTVGSRWKWP